jgi:hypothetical protein
MPIFFSAFIRRTIEKVRPALRRGKGVLDQSMLAGISGAIIRACTRACFGPNKSGKKRRETKPFPFVDTLYARELRAESTAVSLFLI